MFDEDYYDEEDGEKPVFSDMEDDGLFSTTNLITRVLMILHVF